MALFILTKGQQPIISSKALYTDALLPILDMVRNNKVDSMTHLHLYQVFDDINLKAKEIIADINGVSYKYQLVKGDLSYYLKEGSVILHNTYKLNQDQIRESMKNEVVKILLPNELVDLETYIFNSLETI
jgi:hypothetical protein